MTVTQNTAQSHRSGGEWPHNATFPRFERRHCWISDVHAPPQPGRHRAPQQPKVSLTARLLAVVTR